MAAGAIDVTLPGRAISRGRLHPSTRMLRRIYQIWGEMGFQVYRSRDVETDEMNFQLLNFPPNHPAREMQDSFYFKSDEDRGENPLLLRTHTSGGQIHAMREYAAENPDNPPPVRIIPLDTINMAPMVITAGLAKPATASLGVRILKTTSSAMIPTAVRSTAIFSMTRK